MSDWQVGNKAVRVKNDCPRCSRPGNINRALGKLSQIGRVYEVAGFSAYKCVQGAGLLIVGLRNHNADGVTIGWCRNAFRKIRPDEHAACEPEFVTLLKRTKHKVQA